jgi:hypothetical protein
MTQVVKFWEGLDILRTQEAAPMSPLPSQDCAPGPEHLPDLQCCNVSLVQASPACWVFKGHPKAAWSPVGFPTCLLLGPEFPPQGH